MERGIGVPEYNADVDIVVSGEKMPPISAKGNGKKKVLKVSDYFSNNYFDFQSIVVAFIFI